MSNKIVLTSTVVVPSFESQVVDVTNLTKEGFITMLSKVSENYCGHPITIGVLKKHCPTLPEKNGQFWDGVGLALAARPKAGVRGASTNGDTEVTIDDLEFCMFYVEKK